ncbi:MAG: hypothetical protein C5B49_06480, partial [Bdellovibrio sp.]
RPVRWPSSTQLVNRLVALETLLRVFFQRRKGQFQPTLELKMGLMFARFQVPRRSDKYHFFPALKFPLF